MKQKSNQNILQGIVLYKLFTSTCFLLAGLLLFVFAEKNIMDIFLDVMEKLGFLNNDNLVLNLKVYIEKITARGIYFTAIYFIFAASLHYLQAYGLYIRRRWAEWLTVIATGVFIPFEIYYLITKPSIGLFITFLVNTFIVVFLVIHKEMFKTKAQVDFQKHPENYT